MTYGMLLGKIVGYKIRKSQTKGHFNDSLVLLSKTFSEFDKDFHYNDTEDDAFLYFRMRDAYEHIGEYLAQLAGKKLDFHSQNALLEHLLERDSLVIAMGLLKANSPDPEKNNWDSMTLNQYFKLRKMKNGQNNEG